MIDYLLCGAANGAYLPFPAVAYSFVYPRDSLDWKTRTYHALIPETENADDLRVVPAHPNCTHRDDVALACASDRVSLRPDVNVSEDFLWYALVSSYAKPNAALLPVYPLLASMTLPPLTDSENAAASTIQSRNICRSLCWNSSAAPGVGYWYSGFSHYRTNRDLVPDRSTSALMSLGSTLALSCNNLGENSEAIPVSLAALRSTPLYLLRVDCRPIRLTLAQQRNVGEIPFLQYNWYVLVNDTTPLPLLWGSASAYCPSIAQASNRLWSGHAARLLRSSTIAPGSPAFKLHACSTASPADLFDQCMYEIPSFTSGYSGSIVTPLCFPPTGALSFSLLQEIRPQPDRALLVALGPSSSKSLLCAEAGDFLLATLLAYAKMTGTEMQHEYNVSTLWYPRTLVTGFSTAFVATCDYETLECTFVPSTTCTTFIGTCCGLNDCSSFDPPLPPSSSGGSGSIAGGIGGGAAGVILLLLVGGGLSKGCGGGNAVSDSSTGGGAYQSSSGGDNNNNNNNNNTSAPPPAPSSVWGHVQNSDGSYTAAEFHHSGFVRVAGNQLYQPSGVTWSTKRLKFRKSDVREERYNVRVVLS